MSNHTDELTSRGANIGLTDPCAPTERIDLSAIAIRVKEELAERGWAEVGETLSESEFEAVGRSLGVIGLRTHVVIDPERDRIQRESRSGSPPRPGIYTHGELELHTDRPSALWIGWYCVRQDANGGATLLVDTRDLADHFTTGQLDRLSQIYVDYNIRDPHTGRERMCPWPLLERDGSALKLYYVPWLVRRDDLDEDGLRLLDDFARYVAEKRLRSTIPIRLTEGQSLFVDNRRIIHGRAAIDPGSPRHLIRLYIGNEDTNDMIPGPR